MTTRIVADVLIPGRGEPIEQGTVVLDAGAITYAGPTAGAPANGPDDDVVDLDQFLAGYDAANGVG